jgi:hypothetical protein
MSKKLFENAQAEAVKLGYDKNVVESPSIKIY